MCVCGERERSFRLKELENIQIKFHTSQKKSYVTVAIPGMQKVTVILLASQSRKMRFIHLTTLAKGQDYTGLDRVIHLPLYTSY